jgi:carbon storage regulator
MLVLTRRIGERIRVGDDIEIVVLQVAQGRVKLGLAAPPSISLRRGELAVRDTAHTFGREPIDSCGPAAAVR